MTEQGSAVANSLFDFVKNYDMDLIIGQNTNALPMTLLGGLGVYKLITDMRVAAVLHHHDFWWERSRFSQNHIESLLTKIMPPADLGIEHVVLSSYAAHILRSLKRVNPVIIPNCEDFDNAVVPDEYNSTFRSDLGFRDDDVLIVQPTRIVRRKRLEDSIELLHRLLRRHRDLDGRVHLIVSLYQGDEPDMNYVSEVRSRADTLGIPLHLISDRVSSIRGTTSDGRKIYTNRDVLVNADMVIYLPIWEGFGNALLEAIAARVPLVVTTYLVYKTDIKVTGIRNIEIRDSYDEEGRLVIQDESLDQMYDLLNDRKKREEITTVNFEIAKKEYSFDTLRSKLLRLFTDYTDEIKASRKRLKKSKMLYSV
jgi:glycosyltransferase involved in cell wall biosynthesis